MKEKPCGDTAGGKSKEQVKLRQLSKNGSFWKASGLEQGGRGKAGRSHTRVPPFLALPKSANHKGAPGLKNDARRSLQKR
jgi:hypothetical protein